MELMKGINTIELKITGNLGRTKNQKSKTGYSL